jgi:2-(1,2-epoxy-1,2-dihydrophenyl)acetyl-CoA isomerase
MEEEPRVLSSFEDGVTTLTLNRPDVLNALDLATLGHLDSALAVAANDRAVRCLLLTGAGRAFCAGADVKEWAAPHSGGEASGDDWATTAHRIVARLYRMAKPVVAAVNGVAVGAGFDLALAADFRLAADGARFGAVYTRLGIPPDVGGSFLLPRIVGVVKAKDLIYSGRIIAADEALAAGIVTEVLPGDRLLGAAGELAARLAGGPTVAIGAAKECIQENMTASIESALAREHQASRLCMTTEDHAEGLAAIGERRQPRFGGH